MELLSYIVISIQFFISIFEIDKKGHLIVYIMGRCVIDDLYDSLLRGLKWK